MSDIYSRTRLTEKLAKAAERPMVLVVAPAAYGKTTAVADFVRSRPQARVAWLTLSELDNRPIYFRRHLADALSALAVRPAEAEGFGKEPAEITAETLFADFLDRTERLDIDTDHPLYLVLDNYDLIKNALLPHWANRVVALPIPGLTVFVLSRTIPDNLALATLSLRRQLSVLSIDDLQFTPEETAAWLKTRTPSTPEERAFRAGQAADLHRDTDGWIGAMCLQVHPADTGIVGVDVANLIDREIFSALEPETREFLLSVSCLEECAPNLCDAVRGKPGAEELLALAARATPFLRPEANGETFCLHPLFRDFLRKKCRTENPKNWRRSQEAAGDFLMAQNRPMEAAEYYCRAGCSKKLLDAVRQNFDGRKPLSDPGECAQRIRYLNSVPIGQLRSHLPILEAFRAMAFFELRQIDQCLACIAEARKYYEPRPHSETRTRILGELEVVTGCLAFNDLHAMDAAFRRAWDILQSASVIVTSSPLMTFGAPSMLFLCHSKPGELDRVIADHEREAETHVRLFANATVGMNELLRGELAYERGDFETALASAREAEALTKRFDQYSSRIVAVFLQMEIAIAHGDYEETKRAMDRIEEIVDGSDDPVSLRTADHCRVRYAGALAVREPLPEWLALDRPDEGHALSCGVGVEYISCFNALFANGDYARCAELLPTMRAVFEERGILMGRLYATIYEAMLAWTAKDAEKAGKKLFEAWSLARQDGLTMAFVEQSETLLPLLDALNATHAAAGDPKSAEEGFAEWSASIKFRMTKHIRALRRLRLQAGRRRTTGLDILSRREREVYELLLQGFDRKGIGTKLGISLNNVKAIVRRLHDKLDRAAGNS